MARQLTGLQYLTDRPTGNTLVSTLPVRPAPRWCRAPRIADQRFWSAVRRARWGRHR